MKTEYIVGNALADLYESKDIRAVLELAGKMLHDQHYSMSLRIASQGLLECENDMEYARKAWEIYSQLLTISQAQELLVSESKKNGLMVVIQKENKGILRKILNFFISNHN